MGHELTLLFGLVLILGMAAQWLAWAVQIPAIVLLATAGILVGPVFGIMEPSEDLGGLLEPLIKLGVAIILFEGGLSLQWHELRQAAAGVRRLVSLNVLFMFVLGSTAAFYLGGLSLPVAMVFGAIGVVTGPTVILPLLRHARLRKRPASFLKWEGIINDPIGALLAVALFEYFTYTGSGGGNGWEEMAVHLALGLALALALGVAGAWLMAEGLRRGHMPEYLKGPIALAGAIAVYIAANLYMEELGLMAVTIFGLVLGNRKLASISELRRFKEYIAVILVSAVFILLTADLDPATLLALDWQTVILLAAMIFLVRPASVFLATLGTDMSWRERTLVGWIAPRGIVAAAVAGVFGPRMAEQGYAGAELLLPLVFALILTTVVLHGFTLSGLARYLGLSVSRTNGVLIVGASPWTVGLAEALREARVPVLIADPSWSRLRPVRNAEIPVFHGEVLSEHAEHTLEFNEAGYLLAATDNDAYNALVCTRFAGEFGRHRVFQLPAPQKSDEGAVPYTPGMRGQVTPKADAWYDDLVADTYRGYVFHRTQLTEKYPYRQWRADGGDRLLPVALVREGRQVRFFSPDSQVQPRAGDILIAFGPPGARDDARGPAD